MRLPLDPIHLRLLGMAMIWGASWPWGRIVALNMPPLAAAAARFLLASALLLVWMGRSGRLRTLRSCSATQEQSSGWLPPRGQEHAPMIESIGGHWIMRHVTESKILPASVVDAQVEQKAAAIEAQTGRRPGKKERRDLKDEARLSLLPLAFTKTHGHWVWIDPRQQLLVIDAASPQRADAILTALVEQWPGFVPRMLQTQETPASAMAAWLQEQAAPGAFSLGDECELKATDETRATVRYARHALEIEEIQGHLQAGKRPTRLSLGWGDRCQFVLTDTLQIKKLALSDAVLEGRDSADDHFDADVALTTGELSQLIPQLLEALGGEQAPA